MTQEEYPSGDEEEEEPSSEVVGVASIAVATPTSSTLSLFNSSNENKITKSTCLMAKASMVTSTPTKLPLSNSISIMSDMDSLVVKKELISLEKFMSKLKGETKFHFEGLLGQLGETQYHLEEKEDEITKLREHSREYADEISELSQALKEEQQLCLTIENSHVGLA